MKNLDQEISDTAICNICGKSTSYTLVQDISPYKIIRCKDCSLEFLTPQITLDILDEFYEQDYFHGTENKSDAENYYRLKEVQSFLKTGKVLDVGCGMGRFIKLAQSKNFDIEGTELSKHATTYVQDHFGVNTYQGLLKDIGLKKESFDVVTMWHVIEHLTNPVMDLKKIHSTLKDKGLVFIATPNEDFWDKKANPTRAQDFTEKLVKKEGHLYFFTAKTLKKMMESAGFKVIKMTTDFNKGTPRFEHYAKHHLFKMASFFGVHNSKAILLVGQK